MEYDSRPRVTVTPIPFREAGDDPIRPDLGQEAINELFAGLLSHLRNRADSAYLLTWQGEHRVPRGAILGSYVVGWTQNGMVQSEGGEHIGIYSRIKDVEGPDRQSEMLILAFPAQEEVASA